MPTPFIPTIFSHRSIRSFKPNHPIPEAHIQIIELSAQRAATSCSAQTYSFIRVTQPHLLAKIYSVCRKQRPLKHASLVYIACADLYRLDTILLQRYQQSNQLDALSGTLQGCIDAALAAQNLVLAAEHLGYGTTFIGTCRDKAKELISLLNIPRRVFPLFGIAIGVPNESPPLRPRLPRSIIFHDNSYKQYSPSELEQAINHMTTRLAEESYYLKYSKKPKSWDEHLLQKFTAPWMKDMEEDHRAILDTHMTLNRSSSSI